MMGAIAKVNCKHAGSGSEICKKWFDEHEYCNGCPDMTEDDSTTEACKNCGSYDPIGQTGTGYCSRIKAGDFAQTPVKVEFDFYCKYFDN